VVGFSLDNFLTRELAVTNGVNAPYPCANPKSPGTQCSIAQIVGNGAEDEDIPPEAKVGAYELINCPPLILQPRSSNHFHDPTTGMGLHDGLDALQNAILALLPIPYCAGSARCNPSGQWSLDQAKKISGDACAAVVGDPRSLKEATLSYISAL